MSLLLKISVSSFDRATHIATINDDTGVYNNPANLGGYGAPNEERNTLALVISTIRKNSGNEEVQWSDPLTDAVFNYSFLSDGVFDIRLCALEFEAGAFDPDIMSVGRVFYSVVYDKVYKVVAASGGNIVSPTNDVVNNSISVSDPLNYLVKSYAENKRVSFFCEDMSACVEQLGEEYMDITKTIETMECAFEEGYFAEADDVAIFSDKIKRL